MKSIIGLMVVVVLFQICAAKRSINLDYRLPQNVRPTKYVLNMRMVLDENTDGFEQFTAPSDVTISVNVTEATNVITLNSEYITVEGDEKVTAADGRNIVINQITYQPDLHFYKIHLAETLPVGTTYEIYIPFIAQILTNDTYGLYRGFYVDGRTNETKNMATTFYQPFGARRTFPCFDEPDYKAVFEVNIGRTKKYHTLFNMNLRETTTDPSFPDWEWDRFNPTLPMSTYIICIIVSDFDNSPADSILFPKPVKVWGTPEAIENSGGVFAAEMGAKLLNWYENFTDIPYAFPKMDSIAIPQFAAGAMENWGLNTYRDAYLIYYPGDPDSAYIGVAETLSHELSHQWFGNLATCQWWDQMWLNEGLATFFTYKALVNLQPSFDPEMRYITRHQQSALRFDSNPNKSHPVVIPTDSGFDFFTGTSMEKGGALTRMMEYLFSKPIFKVGLRLYLTENAYKGAHQDSLFQSMDLSMDQSNRRDVLPPGQNTKDVMDTWTLQTGYPLVRVSRQGNLLTVSQENIITVQPDHTWWVPINVVTQDKPVFTNYTAEFWLAPTQQSGTFELPSSSGWVIVNQDSAGFYRVLYDQSLTAWILEELAINPNAFTPMTRAQIVDDSMNLGLLGFIPGLESLMVTKYLVNETNPGVLTSAVKNIQIFLNKSKSSHDFQEVRSILVPRLEKMLDTIGTEDQPQQLGLTNVLRNDILKTLCEYGSLTCASISRKYFMKLQASTPGKYHSVVPRNIQDTIHCGILKTGGAEARSFFKRWYSAETDSTKSKNLFKALSCGKKV